MNKHEGFICPHCMKALDSIKKLQEHFSLCQLANSKFADDNTGIIGILKKAKKTVEEVLDVKNTESFITGSSISNIRMEPNDLNEQCRIYAFYEEPNIKPQPLGVTVDRTDEFINMRRMKLQSSSIETSNLVMRIEKLLSFTTDKSLNERRNFEQSVVQWVQDDLVPMCPSCGVKFGLSLNIKSNNENPIILSSKNNKHLLVQKSSKLKNKISDIMNLEISSSGPLIKKKHHCRLCGGVICSVCSFMFPSTEANRLISSINSRLELRKSLWQGSGSLTWKEDSETSLDSIKSKIKQKEYCIRCCGNCKMQIESKWEQMEQRIMECDVVTMHKVLITEMKKASELISEFQKMSLSLNSGETDYSYQEATQIRSDIVNRCQQIDVLGNKFKSKIPINGNTKEATLFNAIYRNAYLFLQNNFATLKYLPSEEEYKALANQKLMKIRENIKKESNDKNLNTQMNTITQTRETELGWAPSIKTNGVSFVNSVSSNPFEIEPESTELGNVALQIENVRRFIDQARDAKRFNDVEILQRNMVDLEIEYESLQKKLYT